MDILSKAEMAEKMGKIRALTDAIAKAVEESDGTSGYYHLSLLKQQRKALQDTLRPRLVA